MNKSLALTLEEQKRQMRFDERMTLVKKAIDMKNEVENFARESKKLQLEVDTMGPQVLQKQIDNKMLETQKKEMEKNIKDKLMVVLRDEKEVENLQDFYSANINEKPEQTNECPWKKETNDNTIAIGTQKLEIAAQKRVWALRGQIEALELIGNCQTKKIEKINQIMDKVEVVFQENISPQAQEHNDVVM